MRKAYQTRSSTRTLASQPSSQPTTLPSGPSPSSSIEVEDLFNDSSSLTPPKSSPTMSQSPRDPPPHQEEDIDPIPLPAQEPPIQDAVAQLVQLLTAQLRAPRLREQDQAPAPPVGNSRARIKTRDPEPYDGTDPSKLRAFLSQCRLTFRSRPHDFQHDQIKITYAVSWLKGTALRWYEPTLDLPDEELPDHALYWGAFEEALKATFGEPDPVTSATTKLDNLHMKDHHHIARYNVEFNEYAALTGYNDQALYTRYYKGLAPRLKDALVFSGKPATLADLRTRSQALDLRYWERKDEDRPKAFTSQTTSTASSSSSRDSKPKSTSKPLSSAASSSKSKKPDFSNVLGPDGKLLPEEKERRKQNNLCLVCGSEGHFSDKCPHRKAPTKARAADLEPITDEDEQAQGSVSEAELSSSPN